MIQFDPPAVPVQPMDDGMEPDVALPSTFVHTAGPDVSPRVTRTGVSPAAYAHPQKWSEEQVRAWWERRTRRVRDVGIPPRGTDGRNIMRWPIARFEQLCNGNAGMAGILYQDLRNEIEKYEQWRRIGQAGCDRPSEDSGVLSPRAQSRRCRHAAVDDHTARVQTSRPFQAYVDVACDDRRDVAFRATCGQVTAGTNTSPGRGVGASPGRRHSGAAAVSVEEDRQRRPSVPAAKAMQAKASFKFSPSRRQLDMQAAPQRRPATAVDLVRSGRDSRGTPPGVVKQPSKEIAPAKTRVKSAPRQLRGPMQNAPSVSAKYQAAQGKALSNLDAAFSGAQSSPTPARKSHRVSRSYVMEDLGDDTLAQISTPTKGDASDSVGKKCFDRQAAKDDSEIIRRPKGQSGESQQEDDDGTTRRMFDKRLLRRRHKALFEEQLVLWRSHNLPEHTAVPSVSEASSSRVRVCVRKRPLFDYEKQADEFDVLSVRNAEIIVHNCLTKADLRSLFVSHMGFQFSHVLGEDVSDDDVYCSCAAPAVQHALRGGVSTVFMFGQTGSGKTHTMAGLLKRAAMQIFSSRGQQRHSEDRRQTCLTAFEIAGKTMRDLLDINHASKELKIMEDKEHRTRVLGVKVCDVHSAEELLRVVHEAQANRTTRATQVNDTSSRSHAVYRIWTSGSVCGSDVLTLVDCAGSERREDSSHHDTQSRKDAAEINSTIFALKECFRVMRSSKGQQPPFRESLLTRVLSDSFTSDHAHIVAIGTVSPSATDTEHSIGTLRALMQLQGTQMTFEVREDVAKRRSDGDAHPRQWTEEEVRHWLEETLSGRARAYVACLTRGTDGKNLMRWPVPRFTQLCGGDADLGARLYQDLRQRIKPTGSGN